MGKKRRRKKTAGKDKTQENSGTPPEKFDFSNPDVFAVAAVTLGTEVKMQLGLGEDDAHETLRAMGLPTEDADDAAREMERRLVEAQRGPGRPRKSAEEAVLHPLTQKVALAVMEYLMRHPGAAYKKWERHHYSDDFKAFVLDTLMADDELCSTMTVRQAAHATRIPLNTLNAWLTARKKVSAPSES